MRFALIRRKTPSHWWSCVHITRNLEEAYRQAYPPPSHQTEAFVFEPEEGRRGALECFRELRAFKPDILVLIDHSEHPLEFMRHWCREGSRRPDLGGPPIILHCYGDFPIHIAAWNALSPFMAGKKILPVCASKASAGLIGEFFPALENDLPVVPFPVDGSVFRPDPERGLLFRRELGIPAERFVVSYSGRISLQKNPIAVVEAVADFSRESGAPVTLLVAGNPDDIGAEMLGISLPPLFYASHFQMKLPELCRGSKLEVRVIPHLGTEELVGFYNASDLYMSLSAHHDEDYGMAPAEALCSGTPVLLSGWGGFHGFSESLASGPPGAVRIARIDFAGEQLSFDREELGRHLRGALLASWVSGARNEIARAAAARLSIPAVAVELRELYHLANHMTPFSGFSEFASQHSYASLRPGFFKDRGFCDPHYLRLYTHYLRPGRQHPRELVE